MRTLLAAAVGLAVALAGCGGTAQLRTTQRATTRTPAPLPPTIGIPSPGPTNVPAPAAAVAVIRGWADSLRRGDVVAAARYFALPSVLVNGTDNAGRAEVAHIFSARDAAAANAGLSCGAVLISTDLRGRYVNALFRLTDRPGLGGGCGAGIGQTARTNFVISGGKIVEWLRAPSDPGDSGAGSGGNGSAE
jgi:hypothetical protein